MPWCLLGRYLHVLGRRTLQRVAIALDVDLPSSKRLGSMAPNEGSACDKKREVGRQTGVKQASHSLQQGIEVNTRRGTAQTR